MEPLKFTLQTVNPQKLKFDSLLSTMGCDNKPDEFFKAERNNLGCEYERPYVDADYNVLTHSVEVRYAQENNEQSMEVYVVELNDIQRKRLIAHKNRYNQKNLTASFETSIFFKSYLNDTEEGKAFAASLPGKSTREKVAGLLNTSDSTIKRLWYVGDNMPEEFGLISENNSSLKEAEEKIKIMKWKKEQEELKKQPLIDPCKNGTGNIDPAKEMVKDKIETVVNEKNKNNSDYNPSQPMSPVPTSNTNIPSIKETSINSEDQDNEDESDEDEDKTEHLSLVEPVTTTGMINFTQSTIEIEGMGHFSMNVTDNNAQVVVNGKALEGVKYLPVTDLNPLKYANVKSFVFQENKHKGLNIQIIITNFPR